MTHSLQANRAARVSTVLDDDTLALATMDGEEAISRLFEISIVLLSEHDDLTAKALLGTQVSISLETNGRTREFNGIVARFAVGDRLESEARPALFRYEALVRPSLWLLTRGMHCRFFHGRTVLEIVEQVLGRYGVAYRNACSASYPPLEHCAQYNESDFAFVSRLLERDGIFYFFEHANGRDRLVLADSPSAPAHEGSVAFSNVLVHGGPLAESIHRWRFEEELTAGKCELTAFDFMNAKASGQQQSLVARASGDAGDRRYEAARFETHYSTADEGRRLAQAHIEASGVAAAQAAGEASACAIRPGAIFTLTGHPRADQNADYLVTRACYRIRVGDHAPSQEATARQEPVFACEFEALPSRMPFRPVRATPRPQAGTQTAFVVAADGDEMTTERHGCVKVQFHWEQLAPPSASERMRRCWVRVAQGWAGRTWGMVFMPRVGQEVVVAFIDGDPDQPIIVGSLYNSANPPPYALPEHQSISSIRTASLAGDGEHSELRFDDKDLRLLLYTGGRADSYVKRDAFSWVGQDSHAIVQGNQRVKVGSHDLTIDESQRLKVGANASFSAGGDVLHEARANYSVKGEIVHLKAGASAVIEAAAMLTLKCGGSFVTLTPAGVQISGPLVGLNSGGAAGSAPGGSPQAPRAPDKADDGSAAR